MRGSSERATRAVPRELFEPNEQEQVPSHIKPEIFFVLKALEGLELPRSWQLDPKDVETLSIDAGHNLLSPGEVNDVIVVVISGEMGIFTKVNKKRKIPDLNRYGSFDKLSEQEQIDKGVGWMAEAMGIPEHVESLKEKVRRFECQKGTVVTEENTFDIDMVFVVFGGLQLKRESLDHGEKGTSLTFNVGAGDILPSMQILTNEPSMCTATAVEKTIYFKVCREEYRELGEVSNCMFVVMGGRLRSVEASKIIEEYGRLDIIGITDMAEKRARRSTVLAVRFSHLVCIPENLLGYVKTRYPQVGTKLLQLISKCWKSPSPESMLGHRDLKKIQNLRTIAIVPASANVPLTEFTCELYNQLSKHVKSLRLSSAVVRKYFEPDVLKKKADYSLMHWLNVQEISYSLVLYQCDFEKSSWTRRCLRMADSILVIALGNEKKQWQTMANSLMLCNEKGVRQSKELVLLWPEDTPTPHGTASWIHESYYSGYHHIRVANRVFNFGPKVKESDIVAFYETNVYPDVSGFQNDFARLARILTGNAVGLVFGGGGARGAAHAGALKAIIEKKIPIDMVGGTSIGALFASLYATTPDHRAQGRMRDFFIDRHKNNILDAIKDLTWAYCAILTGHRFNMCTQKVIGNVSIEDCWISYFCISTDITTSSMRIHRSGLMWPIVRSSMSIAGYVPPLCDPQDGHLLLDGAYVNNLPADVMRSLGASVVIAIDVGMSDQSHNLTDYGYYVSGLFSIFIHFSHHNPQPCFLGFWVLFKRWWPFGEPIRVLSMSEIQNRLAFVCCENQLEIVKSAPYCFYVKIPIENFGIFDFSKFEEATTVGYDVTRQKLEEFFENSATNRRKLLGCARNIEPSSPSNGKNDNLISFVDVPFPASSLN
uniref:Swiss cheese n=1 Tax=Caenorhabditis japonica TaxID=281687 RepID=A0A8R1I0H6_CAEJA